MKILFVNHLLDPVSGGGTAERTFQLLRFLALSGEECSVITLDIGLTPDRLAELRGVTAHVIPSLNERFFVPRTSAREIRELVADADVVHLSGHWTLLNAMVYRACQAVGKPYLFCPAGALKPFGRSLFMKRLYDKLVGRNILLGAARCVAITDDERDDFVAQGVAEERIEVIPNGIDPALYTLDKPDQAIAKFRMEQDLGDRPYILFLGRLNEIKGPDLLLEGFKAVADRFPDLMLVLAGPDGGMMEALRARAKQSGLAKRVRFTGFVGGRMKAAALSSAKLLAIPSRREAMSIVVLEAGSCKCPVLFTDSCGLGKLAQRGAGIQVAARASDIARGLEDMLANPIALALSAQRLSEAVADEYLWSIQAKRYAAICRQVDHGKPV